MEPITLALIALGSFAVLGGGKRSSSRGVKAGGWAVKGEADRVAMLNEIRNMSFHYSNEFGSMPLLADFLTVTGFRESRFNPAATNPEVKTNPENAARGLFGMRPQTAFRQENGLSALRASPNLLLNPRWSFVCAVFHIWDCCDTLARKGYTPNFAAVRRWWGRPHLADDYDLADERSRASVAKLEKAIHDCNRQYGTNLNPDFIWQPIQGWQNYPGMNITLHVYGLAGQEAA